MHFSLFVGPDQMPSLLRSQLYTSLEHQVLAAELSGFHAVWFAHGSTSQPTHVSNTLRILQHLSGVTDRIDLGMIVQPPPPAQCQRFLEELISLNDFSGGRLRLALDLGNAPQAAISWAEEVAEALELQDTPWLARQMQIVAADASVVEAGTHGFGLLLPPTEHVAHTRHIQLAHYHQAREAQPGWVARHLSLAVQKRTGETAIVGTAAQIIAQLVATQLAEGLDEVVCELAASGARANASLRFIELLGREVLPHFAEYILPHTSTADALVLSHSGEDLFAQAALAVRRHHR